MGTNWPIVRVEDVCSLIVDCVNKTAPVSFHPTNFRMIRTTNVRNGKINLSDCKYVDEETYKKWTRRARLEAGDVILTREAPIGEVGQIPKQDGLFLGQRLMQYRADPEKLDDRFLLYSFLSPQLQHQFGSHEGSGSVVSHIRVGDCFKFEMRLPPLVVQKRIGEILGSLDEKIDFNRRINQTLEAMAQAIFKSWFVDFDPVKAKIAAIEQGQDPLRAAMRAISGKTDAELDQMPREHHNQLAATAALFPDAMEDAAQGSPNAANAGRAGTASELGEIPKGWEVSNMRSLAEVISKGTTPSKLDLANAEDKPTIPFIKVKDISESGEIVRAGLEYISKSIHKTSLKRSILKEDDLLFSIAGTIGRTAIVDSDLHGANINQAVAFIRLHNKPNHYVLCWLILRSRETQNFIASKIVQAVQANASLANIGDIPVKLASENVLDRFNSLVSPLIREYRARQREVRVLASLRDMLLPKLLSGELRIPDTERIPEEV